MKKVKATKRGFDGVCMREVGDEFMFANPDPKWMKVISEEEEPKKQAPKGKEKGKSKDEPASEPEGQDVL